ncbi:MAG: signal peptide peptidase SppA [Planctomycetota bacterium]|nr:signal peptide peptidase SppA [Planctomycetota bacterium]
MKTVLQITLAFLLAFLIATAIVVLLGFGLVAAAASGSERTVERGSILTVDLSEAVSERGGEANPMALLQGAMVSTVPAYELASALRHAAQDDRVKGVLLHGGLSGSMSALAAARDALAEVRAAKKPVFAYYASMDEKAIWFASAADETWMEPLDVVIFDGFSADIPYFGDMLKKYGIEVQVTRVGKYKSAVEPFLLGRMSAENKEQMEAILADVQSTMYGEIASAKGLDVAKLQAVSREKGWLTPDQAIELGIVTKAAPFGDMLARLKEVAGVGAKKDVPQVALQDYARAVWKNGKKGDGIQVIVAEGEIVDGESSEGIGGDDLARRLRAAREDEHVKAVVMRVDSPGGSATASDVIRSEVLALKAAGKPVVVSMGRLAASGGYWISANADAIVAQPETLTGSIGVFGMLPNIEKLAEEHGLRAETVRTSPLSGFQSIWHRKDDAQLARVQALVDRIYDRFLGLVAEGRGMTRERVHEIAQGRVWSGMRGKELGLVDEIGDLDRAIAIAREKARLGADAPVRYERRDQKLLDEILEELIANEREPLTRALVGDDGRKLGALSEALAVFEHARRLAGTSGVVARLPFDFDVR